MPDIEDKASCFFRSDIPERQTQYQRGEGHLSRLEVHGSINKNVFYDQFCEVVPTAALMLCSKISLIFRAENNLCIQSYCGN